MEGRLSHAPARLMDHAAYSDAYIADILTRSRSFALVGASGKPSRPSSFVLKYLLGKGFDVHPVNPGLAGGEILGRRVYGSLAELPGPIDVVDIFRGSDAVPAIVRQAIAEKDRLGITVIWMQIGVRHPEAAAWAEAAGLAVVMNRCPKIEYGRLSGEIGWAGVNARTISAVRPKLAARGVQSHVLRAKS